MGQRHRCCPQWSGLLYDTGSQHFVYFLVAAPAPCLIGLQLKVAADQVHALVDSRAVRTLMDEVIFTKACLKIGRPSLLHPTGTVCWSGGNPLPVISETELHLTDTGTMKVLSMKTFPHKLLSGSDSIFQRQGKIDYARREMKWFGKSFQIAPYSDSLPTTASVYDSCGHPCIDEVMRQYTDVFDDDLSSFSHCNLILLTVDVNGHKPTRQNATAQT